MSKDKKENFIEIFGFKPIEFKIEGKVKKVSILKAAELYSFLGKHLKTCASMMHELDWYNNYEEKLDGRLNEIEKEWDDDQREVEYECGANYAQYLGTSREVYKGLKMSDNHKASKILKKEFGKLYPDNTLLFDAESSHCYVYTKNKEEAKTFLLWVYNTYIKPSLKDWYEGWEDFVKEWNEADDSKKIELSSLW